MARPINEEMKKSIERTAFTLFDTVGYDKATYAAIADERGISRNLVQYHFPKKEKLAVSYMETLLEQAQASLGFEADDLVADAAALTDVGTAFFEDLMSTEGKRTFLLDIIRSRDLTEDVLAFNASWALAHFGVSDSNPEANDSVVQSVVLHMGGFYELLYYSLKNDKPLDVRQELKRVVDSFVAALEA